MKIVKEDGGEFAVVGNVAIPIAEDGYVCAEASFEEMLYSGILGEHAPSGMVFEMVGYDEWDWEWHPWNLELDHWCNTLDLMDRLAADIDKKFFAA